jgi:hypothetical protein
LGKVFFFKIFSKLLFQILKFKLFSKVKHFKPFSKFSKQFKNFYNFPQQTINTMQPKDDAQALTASKIIKMILKYLKAKFI